VGKHFAPLNVRGIEPEKLLQRHAPLGVIARDICQPPPGVGISRHIVYQFQQECACLGSLTGRCKLCRLRDFRLEFG
jgi:hypothetical protein